MHDGGIHVPGIIRWPGKVRAETTSSVPVNGTDYLPTFCAVAGAAIPDDRPLDGVDILPGIVSGEKVTRQRPMMWWLFHARGGKQVAMRDGDYKMLAHMSPQADPASIGDAQPPPGWSNMRFIKEARLDGFTMYDLANDPSESKDLSAEQPERFAELKKRMRSRWRRRRPMRSACSPPPRRPAVI